MTLILPLRGGRKERIRADLIASSFQDGLSAANTQTASGMALGSATPGKTVIAFVWGANRGSFFDNAIIGVTIGGVAATLSDSATSGERNSASAFAALETTATAGDVVATFANTVSAMFVHIFEVYNLTSLSPLSISTVAERARIEDTVGDLNLPDGESLIIGGINGLDMTDGATVDLDGLPPSIERVVNRPATDNMISEVHVGRARRNGAGARNFWTTGNSGASVTPVFLFGAFQ